MEPASENHLKYISFLPNYQFDGINENMMISKQLVAVIKCAICFTMMNHPVTLSCGHSFCKNCISQCIQCPLCKKSFSKQSLPTKNITLAEIIDMQEVICPANLNDYTFPCKATGLTIRNIESHVKVCDFIPLKCKCGTSIPRNSFLASNSKCECELYPCEFCSWYTQERLLPYHSEICRKTELLCDSCGVKYTRENKMKHLNEDCFVSCPFFQMGCKNKIKRNDLDKHLNENADLHTILTFKRQFPLVFGKVRKITEDILSKARPKKIEPSKYT